MRVFELAREVNISNQEVIAKLRELGIDVTNHMSSVDEGQARKVKLAFAPQDDGPKANKDERIRRTVIRRRVVKKTEAEEAAEAAEAEAANAAVAPKLAEPAAPTDSTAEAAPASEEAATEAPVRKRMGARVVDKIAPPPQSTVAQPERPKPAEDGEKKPKRVVSKRMYRPSKAEEQTLAKIRQARQKKKGPSSGSASDTLPTKAEKRKIKIEETISVGDLAKSMSVKSGEVIKKFIEMGMLVTINQAVDPETAAVIAAEYGYEIDHVGFQETDYLPATAAQTEATQLSTRPPIVTVMGHVDHGKTSILDAIRKTKVAAGEAGGITQHIGAYQVQTAKGPVTFIDTPGHAAFTAMRARGAQLTDIVVLVVAADDGVMPQTIEAIQHAQAAKVPIVVAVNKCDLPQAQPDRIRQQLTEYQIIPEAWGGENMFVNVSALTGSGIDELLETLALQSEVLELKADAQGQASGIIVEGRLDRGRGAVATTIVLNGVLKPGDIVVCGTSYGRVRAILSDTGATIAEAGPSMPVETLGLNEVPQAGETFSVVKSEKIAREITENRERKIRERELAQQSKVSLENVFQKIQEGDVKDLQVVVKSDVQGSAEAVVQALKAVSDSDSNIRVRVVSSGVGAITENDVNLASASGAILIGFNTRPDGKATRLAQEYGVAISVYSIIYELIDDVKAALQGLLAPEIKEESRGWARVLEIFPIKGTGSVAGSKVESGYFKVGHRVRLVRDGQVLYDGKIANLKRFKDDVNQVDTGLECGMLLENFNKAKVGDELECYETVQVKRVLGNLT